MSDIDPRQQQIDDSVHALHADGLCASPYETLDCAVQQTIEVVKRMRVTAQAAHRFDFTLCPMRRRVRALEDRAGIVEVVDA